MQPLSGTVIHGKALARKIGFPTANIHIPRGIVEDGTYKINIILPSSEVMLGAGAYREKEELFEAHIFDFEGNLYGEKIEIILLEKIRNNQKISSLEELQALIQKDVHIIKSTVFYGITFGTFDLFHPGHQYYLQEAKKYCEKLITVVSTDLNVQKIKHHSPRENQEARKINVQKSKIPDKVFIGEEDNPLKYIKKFQPQVICLGYDQIGFLEDLEKYMRESGHTAEIIRIHSFKPEIFKSSKMH